MALLLTIVVFERRVLGGKFNAGIFFFCLFAILEIYAPPPLDFWFQGNYQFENDRQGLGFFIGTFVRLRMRTKRSGALQGIPKVESEAKAKMTVALHFVS